MVGPSVLIAALSGRAAVMSARRAGFAPYVADLFADEDTVALAAGVRRVEGDLASGFDAGALLDALEALAAGMPEPPIGVVYGAGFEDRPGLLSRIADRWPLLGNAPETVEAVKEPWHFAETLSGLGIPHPEIASPTAAVLPSGWLAKRGGGAGGSHIGAPSKVALGDAASGSSAAGHLHGHGRTYWQRRVVGFPVSALFLGSAAGVQVIGFSEQWTAPAPGQPYRFGGAVTPADIPDAIAEDLARAVEELTPAFGLMGLNSADFIVGPEGWWLLEINPRLGATLDIFDTADGALFTAHLDAVRDGILAPVERPARACAMQLVYAPAPIACVPRLDWPYWSADRPPAGAVIPAQAPCCTVLATAGTSCEARRLCQERIGQIQKLMGVEECRRAS
jgi:predicted ATP-grasp superfamily ATP-dependent carboligase